MESKLVKKWVEEELSPSKDFEYFTRRDNIVIGKKWDQPAEVEYNCPFCGSMK